MCESVCVCVTCGYIDGCICLSSELVDPDFPVLWEEMAASASGRLSSSSWLLATPKIREAAALLLLRVLRRECISRVTEWNDDR